MKKRIVGLVCGCASLALVAGSFAFYTSTNNLDNRLNTGGYGETMTEIIDIPKQWEPGEKVEKRVGIKNTGSSDLLVRIKLDERWWRDANENGIMEDSEKIISFDSTTGNHDDIITYSQADKADGDVTGDKSVVIKTLADNGWTRGTDGYWYYNKILTPDERTNDILSDITYMNGVDTGKKVNHKYWTENAAIFEQVPTSGAGGNIGTDPKTSWVVLPEGNPVPQPTDPSHKVYAYTDSATDPDHRGYSDAIYDLFVTYDTIQATVDAVKSADGWKLTAAPAGTDWGFTW